MKALILIGLQVDFFPLGAAEIDGSEAILPGINEWLPTFEHVVAACFSHPANHKMFVANYPWRRPGQEIDLMGEKILLKNYHCMEGSFGAELTLGFNHHKITHTIFLGTQHRLLPYSAFFDENRARDTGLLNYLIRNQIKEIYLAGLPFEEGVYQTALDGLEQDLRVNIINRAVASKNEEQSQKMQILLRKKGVKFV